MSWRFELTATARRDIERLDADVTARVADKLLWLIDNFLDVTHYPLTGPYAGSFKLRAGDWRIVYKIDNAARVIYVTGVEHRSKAYKKRR